MSERILAIDPGKDKCGLAVVDADLKVIEKKVVPRSSLPEEITELTITHKVKTIILGKSKWGKLIDKEIANLPIKVSIIFLNEKYSTLEGRKRYFQAHPPRGWRRLIPLSLQLPPVPYDDFVAVILAERYLLGQNPKSEQGMN